MRLLLDHGVDLDARDAGGRTALHVACEYRRAPRARLCDVLGLA